MRRVGDIEGLIAALDGRFQEGELAPRLVAVHALGKLRAPEALDALARCLRDDPLDAVRAGAARALGDIGDRRATDVLIGGVSDPDVPVRLLSAEALGKVGDPLAIPVLVDALGDAAAGVRDCAALALGEMRVASAAGALKELKKGLGWWEGRHVRRALRKVKREEREPDCS